MWQLVWKVLGSESAWEPHRPLVPEGAQLVPGKAPHQTASRVNAVGGWPQLGFPWPFRGASLWEHLHCILGQGLKSRGKRLGQGLRSFLSPENSFRHQLSPAEILGQDILRKSAKSPWFVYRAGLEVPGVEGPLSSGNQPHSCPRCITRQCCDSGQAT